MFTTSDDYSDHYHLCVQLQEKDKKKHKLLGKDKSMIIVSHSVNKYICGKDTYIGVILFDDTADFRDKEDLDTRSTIVFYKEGESHPFLAFTPKLVKSSFNTDGKHKEVLIREFVRSEIAYRSTVWGRRDQFIWRETIQMEMILL